MRNMLWLLFILAFAFTAHAQFDQGQITGTVKDSTQAVVSGAAVTAKSAATGQTASTKTDGSGAYLFTNLRLGDYEVSVQAAGFKTFVRTNVTVRAATRTRLDAAMELGATSESITVSATGAALTTLDTAQIGRTIESTQITDLALNGRNPFNMATLKAGVIGDQFNGFNPGWVEQSVSINGGRKNGNAVTMDGVNMLRARGDTSRATNMGVLNVDAIQEVQILTSTYPAEYGRAMDGQLRFVTKSGTRDFHGTAWEFMRNSKLDANSWTRNNSPNLDQNSRQSPFRFNQPGYAIGGPVVIPGKFNSSRNKLFFFVSQEWVWYRKDLTNTSVVPTAAMRSGDFSELLSASNPLFKKVRIVNDPTSGTPFSNNVIPLSRRSPNGVGILNAYPLPTPGYQVGTSNWIKTLPNPITSRKDTVRADYYLGSNRISFSGNNYAFVEHIPFEGIFGTGLDRSNTLHHRPNKLAALAITTTISANKINDFTASGAAERGELDPYVNPEGHDWLPRGQYGINFPYMIASQKTIPDRTPSASIQGLYTLNGGNRPTNSSGPIYSWADNFSWIPKSTHSLKFGVWVEKCTQKNNELVGAENGSFGFVDSGASPLTTGLAIANVVLGNYDSYSESGKRAYTLVTSWAVESYAQDTWKATPNLTVEMGVRWSYRSPWAAKWNDLSEFDGRFYKAENRAIIDPVTGYITSGDAYNGIVLPGSGVPDSAAGRANVIALPNYQRLFHDLPRGFVDSFHNAFAPRLGLAYRLSGKTGIRMGGGAFHNRQMLNCMMGQAPNLVSTSVLYGKVDDPGAGSGGRLTPQGAHVLNSMYKYPTAYSFSFSIQHELPLGAVLDLAYVGKRTRNLVRTQNINELPIGTLIAHPGTQVNLWRPWYGLSTINMWSTSGHASYDAFQLSLDRRFNTGLGFGLSYTYSKALDNITYNAQMFKKAPFEWDRRNVLNLNGIYDLPILKNQRGLAGNLLGGWRFSSVMFYRSGAPLSVTDGTDIAGTGSGGAPWNLVGNVGISKPGNVGALWFNPAAFAVPAAGTFGNAGLGIIVGPPSWNLDASLFKRFRIFERLSSELRFEAFNFLNHPNWGNPSVNPRAGDFGYVTTKVVAASVANVSANERNVQLGVKFIF
jgi:hypothetical protein